VEDEKQHSPLGVDYHVYCASVAYWPLLPKVKPGELGKWQHTAGQRGSPFDCLATDDPGGRSSDRIL